MAVAFEELAGSPTIDVAQQGTSAERIFRVAWDDWQDFARELVGSYNVVGCTPEFVPPIEFPGMPNLVVSRLNVEPLDPDNPNGTEVTTIDSGTNVYPDAGAKVTAVYETLFDANNQPRADLPGVPTGTYLTYIADLGADHQTVPGRVWHWVDPPENAQLPPDVNPGVLIPTGTYRLIWHRVALPPWAAIRDLRGKVNDATFGGAPAGTVLLLGARITREFQFIEDGGFWRVEYRFAEKTVEQSGGSKVGWNYFYKEKAAGIEHWVKVVDDAGNAPYRSGNFSGLFQFATC